MGSVGLQEKDIDDDLFYACDGDELDYFYDVDDNDGPEGATLFDSNNTWEGGKASCTFHHMTVLMGVVSASISQDKAARRIINHSHGLGC
jgi:hypothetical protein